MSDTDPDTAMHSGSDAGEPGERGGTGPLGPDENALLEELQNAGGDAGGDFPEESEAAARAADDDTPLPAEGGPQDDGLTPEFTAPEE